MNLALLAIKLQILLNAITLALSFGLIALSSYGDAGNALGLLIQVIILGGLFLFIKHESKVAASLYIIFALFTYFNIISMELSLTSIPAILDAILSITASYGIIQWWNKARATP